MKKINVVLVALDKTFSESAIKLLNFDIANLVVVLTDTAGEKFFGRERCSRKQHRQFYVDDQSKMACEFALRRRERREFFHDGHKSR